MYFSNTRADINESTLGPFAELLSHMELPNFVAIKTNLVHAHAPFLQETPGKVIKPPGRFVQSSDDDIQEWKRPNCSRKFRISGHN